MRRLFLFLLTRWSKLRQRAPARQSQIEAKRSEGGGHSNTMADDGGSIWQSRSKLFASILISGLISCPLLATVNEPIRLDLSSGYRTDDFHWHLQEGGSGDLTYSEKYKNLQFWENDLTFRVICRDISFEVEGGYGAFGSGDMKQTWDQTNFTTDAPQFIFSTKSWGAHASGYLGYAVNLTADRHYKVILTPLVGYGGYFLHLHNTNPSPALLSSDAGISGQSYTATSNFSHTEHSTWYGWMFGGSLVSIPVSYLRLEAGYAYNLLRSRLITDASLNTSLGNESFSLSYKEGGNFGHLAWAKLEYTFAKYWRIGGVGRIQYFFSPVQAVTVEEDSADVREKLKERWTSISGLLTISREL